MLRAVPGRRAGRQPSRPGARGDRTAGGAAGRDPAGRARRPTPPGRPRSRADASGKVLPSPSPTSPSPRTPSSRCAVLIGFSFYGRHRRAGHPRLADAHRAGPRRGDDDALSSWIVRTVRSSPCARMTAACRRWSSPETGGFVRGVLRSLVRRRTQLGLGPEAGGFALNRLVDGHITLSDPATGERSTSAPSARPTRPPSRPS